MYVLRTGLLQSGANGVQWQSQNIHYSAYITYWTYGYG